MCQKRKSKYICFINQCPVNLNGLVVITFHMFYSANKSQCGEGVMVKAMDCGIVVSEFEFQSRYYVHFRANTFGKGRNRLIIPAMG